MVGEVSFAVVGDLCRSGPGYGTGLAGKRICFRTGEKCAIRSVSANLGLTCTLDLVLEASLGGKPAV
jgi:hypothetical protein